MRNTETGNGGVINLVNSTPSSIGYADLAFARELKFFSSKEDKGGEDKKGEANPKLLGADPEQPGDGRR